MAPGMLPIPPSTAAVKALMPAMKPMKGLSLPMLSPISTPPTAASMAPSTKVKEITLLVSMPSRLAICMSSAQARQARPMRECAMNSVSAIISASATPTINKRPYGNIAPPRAYLHVFLQENGHADRGDQRHQPRPAPQRAVGHALDHETICPRDQHRD